ncbi:MAG TPA: carbamoyltransferase C-terminal domain-containing protein [Polyangia bacterium]
MSRAPTNTRILGLWDGHDCGAVLIEGGEVRVAINEERFSRRKLETRFPHLAIQACLKHAHLQPKDIDTVAYCTIDVSKTLRRLFPSLQESYYKVRRRKGPYRPPRTGERTLKYWVQEKPGNRLTSWLSRHCIDSELVKLGFSHPSLVEVEHHAAHAATAAYMSGFDAATVLTLDGLGDGLSATVNRYENGRLERLEAISAADSLGVFFEYVTDLLNMRMLEDEGKVMALATHAYPVPDQNNPLLGFFSVEGVCISAKYHRVRLYEELKKVLWRVPSEQFAHMAQRTLEVHVLDWVRNAVRRTGQPCVAMSGGVAANIKVNMLIRDLPEVQELFVFPHMGDGGLAAGCALHAAAQAGQQCVPMRDVYLGPDIDHPGPPPAGIEADHLDDAAEVVIRAAERIADGEIILWFDGRMEYGPRALGHRSILARPDLPEMRERLNLQMKRRVWYQPFCPSILDEDAAALLEKCAGRPNRFMTVGYRAKPESRERLQAVLGVDGSCRPQFVADDGTPYALLLKAVKEKIGLGCVLNTSMNLHGEPLVASIDQAWGLMSSHGFKYLFCPGLKKIYRRA